MWKRTWLILVTLLAKTKDTWVKIGNEWKFKKMEIVESKVMIDGKVVKA